MHLDTEIFKNKDIELSLVSIDSNAHDKLVRNEKVYTFVLPLDDGVYYGEQPMNNKMLLCIRPGDDVVFSALNISKQKIMFLSFSTEIADAFFTYLGEEGTAFKESLLNASKAPVCALNERQRHSILESLHRFEVTQPKRKTAPNLSMRFFILETFSYFAKKFLLESELETNSPLWLETVCQRMRSHENFSEGISKMVELSGKTREHLARSMQKYKQITLSKYINNLRLEYVADMLISSDLSIVDLCYESGFSSLDYFGKLFKKKYGMTPSRFRSVMKDNQ